MLRPNVSHCVSENDVHYNPNVETRIIGTLTVSDASKATRLCSGKLECVDYFDNIEVDGENISISDADTNGGVYLSAGEHVVKYTLKDSSIIPQVLFGSSVPLTSVIIPSSITEIGERAFVSNDELSTVTISATTPPTLGTHVFYKFHNKAEEPYWEILESLKAIYVPSGSVDAYKAAENWSDYATLIQAIP